MSNALALASVTAILNALINKALIDNSVSVVVGGTVDVTAIAPDQIDEAGADTAQLNLFLYQITPNPGWRNVGMPSRDERGERLTNPPLALDLYYLLTAYGRQDFEAEILLGYAMQKLHETPVMTRNAIRDILVPAMPVGSVTPELWEAVTTSELAEQIEQIKIVPHSLNTEETSKLWSAFQASYRSSFAYQVSVVLIESKHPSRSPLPVLSRGPRDPVTNRDRGVVVQPDLLPPFPTVEQALPPNRQMAIRMGETLTLTGFHLNGDQVKARFTHARSSRTLELAAEPGATATKLEVKLPPDPNPVPPNSPLNPDNWQVGVYMVEGVIERALEETRTTNAVAIALVPLIKSVVANQAGGVVTFTVQCSPKIWEKQHATLVVGTREIASDPIPPGKTGTLPFIADLVDLPTGAQWVRLRVDGVESILIDRSGPQPAFDPTQQVTI